MINFVLEINMGLSLYIYRHTLLLDYCPNIEVWVFAW